MTWKKEDTMKYSYPRFKTDRDFWKEFKAYCVKKGISVDKEITRILFLYMKQKGLLPKDYINKGDLENGSN